MHSVKITVTLRKSILDPQGKAIEHAISTLGYSQVSDIRTGKLIELKVGCATRDDAERVTNEICKKLLANPVMEDYTYEIETV
ncbi:MAG: phosphoribosylformylglycinamidine synthase subunit PurS [Bacteroidota bacterium]